MAVAKANEEWVTLREASRQLKTTVPKLSRMAQKGEIKSKKSIRDARVILVDLTELRRLFAE